MCGIAGHAGATSSTPPHRVEATLEALSHRGPDARQVWQDPSCTLLHCRLRVIDTSARADQPMVRQGATRVAMVFNGEVYNYRELRKELERSGVRFDTTADSEVFLAGYQAWGDELFRRARGMWAAAFWHPDPGRLVLVRDPLGKKPMVYTEEAGQVWFASSVTALLALTGREPALDPAALDCYLAHLVVPFEHCIVRGVRKVPPGGIIEWQDGTVRERIYWSIPDGPAPDGSQSEAGTESLLRQAVRRRLVSDVPLGVFLSAGLDSGLVAAIAAQESGAPLIAVTAGTTGSGSDERPVAAILAARYGLRHRPLEVPPLSAESLPMLIAELGEPFGDASLLPSYQVARAARREITVALTGDGGDEAFFGYDSFRAIRYAAAWRRWTPAPARHLLARLTAGFTTGALRRAGALFEYGAMPLAAGYRNRMGFSASERDALLIDPSARGRHQAEHIYRERLARWSALPETDAMRRTLFQTYLPNDYLPKVDTATMAASLEARSPFLDVDLVEHALRLPAETAFAGGVTKAPLRPLAERLLPAEFLDRPKTGFTVPVGRWLRQELEPALEEFVFRSGSRMSEIIQPAAAREIYRRHRNGADHATRLWGLLALGVWCAVIVERRWSPADPLPVDRPVPVPAR